MTMEYDDGASGVMDERVHVRTGRDLYRTEVTVRQHSWVADEPPSLGGTDTGPTPFDLLCAALGTCTTITLRMYADRKGWPLEDAIARVEHRRIPRGGDEVPGPPADRFVVEVDLRGDLLHEQRLRLGEIASRCPVHKVLAAGAVIDTRCS
jgi:uncharacterized OsmC-like protein